MYLHYGHNKKIRATKDKGGDQFSPLLTWLELRYPLNQCEGLDKNYTASSSFKRNVPVDVKVDLSTLLNDDTVTLDTMITVLNPNNWAKLTGESQESLQRLLAVDYCTVEELVDVFIRREKALADHHNSTKDVNEKNDFKRVINEVVKQYESTLSSGERDCIKELIDSTKSFQQFQLELFDMLFVYKDSTNLFSHEAIKQQYAKYLAFQKEIGKALYGEPSYFIYTLAEFQNSNITITVPLFNSEGVLLMDDIEVFIDEHCNFGIVSERESLPEPMSPPEGLDTEIPTIPANEIVTIAFTYNKVMINAQSSSTDKLSELIKKLFN